MKPCRMVGGNPHMKMLVSSRPIKLKARCWPNPKFNFARDITFPNPSSLPCCKTQRHTTPREFSFQHFLRVLRNKHNMKDSNTAQIQSINGPYYTALRGACFTGPILPNTTTLVTRIPNRTASDIQWQAAI